VAEVPLESFVEAGLTNFDAIRGASDEALLGVHGITPEKIANVRAAINFLRPDTENGSDTETQTPDSVENTTA
jgi:N utilization substance protein A